MIVVDVGANENAMVRNPELILLKIKQVHSMGVEIIIGFNERIKSIDGRSWED